MQRRWPVLASLGVNAGLIALLALIPARNLPQSAPSVIDVTLVERDEPEPEAEPDPLAPEPEPEPEPTDPVEDASPPPPDTKSAEQTPAHDRLPATGLQSPILAPPDETADAAPLTGRQRTSPDIDLPMFDARGAQQQERTETALRGLACNRLGRERPGWCDEAAPDSLDAPQPPAFAEEPDMARQEWAAFEPPEHKEWCPDSDGVIKDVVVTDQNPYRQGAAAAVGTLATSAAATCSD